MTHTIEVIDELAITQLDPALRTHPIIIALPHSACSELVSLTNLVHKAGFVAIPTIPARRVKDEEEVGSILRVMNQFSLTQALLVGGNDTSSTLFQDSTGLAIHCINRHDSPLRHVYFAAHPEGTIEDDANDLISIMKQKEDICFAAGLKVTFITQLCLAPDVFANWIKMVRAAGISAPVSMGISTSCSASALQRRLQFCFNVRKARLTDSYQMLNKWEHGFVPKTYIQELRSRVAFEQVNVCGYHWYGFDTLQNVAGDIDSTST